MAAQNKVQFVVECVDKASKPLKDLEENFGSIQGNMRSMIWPSQMFAGALGWIAAGAGFLWKEMLSTAGQFEKYHAILKVATGSTEEATEKMNMLKEFAKKTPYELTELTESFIKFTNRGIKVTANELTKFGDLASSQGKSFDMLTEAVLDATGGEFERLKEFGIKASKNGDQVSMSFKGMTQTVKNSQEDISAALLKFGSMNWIAGSMDAVSKTWEGVISNLSDAWWQFLAGQGAKILDFFKGFVVKLSDFVTNDLPNIINNLEKFFNMLVENKPALIGVAAAIMTLLAPALIAAAVAAAPFIIAAAELAAIAGVVGAAVYGLWILWSENFLGIQDKTKAVWDFLTGAFATFQTVWLPQIQAFLAAAGAEFNRIAGEWLPIITNAMQGIWTIISTVFGVILAVVTPIVQALVGFISDNWWMIKAITSAVFDGIVAYFTMTWWFFTGIFKAWLQLLGGDWSGAWETIKETFGNTWNAMVTIFQSMWTILVGVITIAWEALKAFLSLEWEGLKIIFGAVWDGIASIANTVWGAIQSAASAVWGAISNAIKTIWNSISSAASTVWDGIKNVIVWSINFVIGWFTGLWKKAFELWFTGMLDGIVWIAKGIFNSVVGFIEGFINKVINGINAMIGAANSVGGAVGINIGTIPTVAMWRLAHGGIAGEGMFGGRAIAWPAGIDTVPTLLSAGEVVLNAAWQNNVARKLQGSEGSSVTVNVTGNSFFGDDERFAEKIGDKILETLKLHVAIQSF